jgi:hypothetical protein
MFSYVVEKLKIFVYVFQFTVSIYGISNKKDVKQFAFLRFG